jgi:SMI1-KNR4 cell-wall
MEIKEKISAILSTPERIQALERDCGGQFPSSYRDFLRLVNGGRPVKRRFKFVEAGRETESAVSWFFGDCDNATYDISKQLTILKHRIPNQFVPIAIDPFGNIILLFIGLPDYGAVFFWDHEREDPDNLTANLFKIASSFEEFTQKLN